MHHNLEWIGELDIEYDASTFDTDPFEPQSNPASTIWPFWVENRSTGKGYVESSLLTSQDFSLFVIMRERKHRYLENKIGLDCREGGMALLINHPDYMNLERQLCFRGVSR